jgi:hypothetical protein
VGVPAVRAGRVDTVNCLRGSVPSM